MADQHRAPTDNAGELPADVMDEDLSVQGKKPDDKAEAAEDGVLPENDPKMGV